jgi:hypothetical protein
MGVSILTRIGPPNAWLIALAKELKQFDIECEEVWGNGGVVKYVGSEFGLVQLRK